MKAVLTFAYWLALGLYVGKITYFSFFVAPLVARQFAPGDFGRFVRAMFPRYYLLGAVCTGVATLSAFALDLPLWVSIGCAALFTLELFCREFLTPLINRLRDQREALPELEREASAVGRRWAGKHKLSVRLNAFALLLALVLLAASAAHFAPS
jgi:hypothetical protein